MIQLIRIKNKTPTVSGVLTFFSCISDTEPLGLHSHIKMV